MIALLSDCFPGAYEKDIRWKKINRLAPSVSVLCFVSLFVWLRRQSLTSNIIVHSWGAGGGEGSHVTLFNCLNLSHISQ